MAGLALIAIPAPSQADDQPQWGEKYSRNMVSEETGLPASFDPATGKNVKWSVSLGTRSYSTPVIADGRILVGTNNELPRDPRHQGDYGILLCLSETDGSFLWQLAVPKLADERKYQDWPNTGIASPAAVEGDAVYLVNNRNQVMRLDLDGQADGNDGPFQEEGRHMVPLGQEPLEVTASDADIVWIFDIQAELGVEAHDAAHCSVLAHGPYLYICTSNGVDAKHNYMVATEAPSLIVLEKATGRLVARDREPIGPNIIHSTWSSPAFLSSGDRDVVLFGGGNGVCYAFEALPFDDIPSGPVATLEKAWQFDCDPAGPKEHVHQYRGNRETSASNIYGMPVALDKRVYITVGGDFWHGKRQSWIKCFEPEGTGDITASTEIWSYPLEKHCMGTPAVRDGLVYIGDTSGRIHCLDAKTGAAQWVHETPGVIWGSPLVADGKVYIANQRGKLTVLSASRKKEVIGETQLQGAINSSPIAANGTLYITTMTELYALEAK